VLAMVLAQNYSEFRQVMSFYAKLEAHWTPGWKGLALQAAQFGWAIFALAAAIAIFPSGVLVAVLVIALTGLGDRVVSKRWPQLHANLNFQVRAAAVCVGVFAIALGATVGLKDNLSLAYKNFQSAINALTLPASETLAMLGNQVRLLTADVTDSGRREPGGPSLQDVDYLAGRGLTEVRAGAQAVPATPTGSAAAASVSTGCPAPLAASAATFAVKPGNTFWDEAVKAAKSCGVDASTKAGERAVYLSLKAYLENNRARLVELARAPKNTRLPAMDLPRYLPAGTLWDVGALRTEICK